MDTRKKIPSATVLAAGIVLLVACWAGQWAAAAPIAYQDGLPEELVIKLKKAADGSVSRSDLEAQARLLDKLATEAKERQPKVGFLQRFLGSADAPRALTVPDLLGYGAAAKGQLVAVEGMYGKSTDLGTVVRLGGQECPVTLAGGTQPEGFDTKDLKGLPVKVTGTVEMIGTIPSIRAHAVEPAYALSLLRKARALELAGNREDAIDAYIRSEGAMRGLRSDLGAFARINATRIAYDDLRDKKLAGKHGNMAWTTYLTNVPKGQPAYHTWIPNSASKTWKRVDIREALADKLNSMNSESFWYGFVGFFVALCGGNPAFGCLLLAFVVRLIIWPLTKKQLQSAEAMKKLQPQIKELQARHADDKQKFQQEFWKLCQANGVNPLGGCLPLIVQMPVLIMVYKGIRLYVVEFDKASFLWVDNLAGPDMVLLVAYTISMILFQQMTQKTNPQAAMDPQQQQQQKMMMYMMPLMFFFMFRSFPAAFILYWLGTNIVYFGQQWNYTRRADSHEQAPAAKPSGFVDKMARMLSGEPGATDAEDGEQKPSEAEDVDRRSMEEIEREKRESGRKPRKRSRRR